MAASNPPISPPSTEKTLQDPDQCLANYHFSLPPELIAQRPLPSRDHSRLLVYHCSTERVEHSHFHQLHRHLPPRSVLLLNDSKVFPCRLTGRKESGGKVEIFLLSPRENERGLFPCLLKSSGKKRQGERYLVDGVSLELADVQGDLFWLKGEAQEVRELLANSALVPIPPYIRGGVGDRRDEGDYQTLYAQSLGSVAAPTAGLHFTPQVLANLRARDIATPSLTLHVGHGTFAPIKAEKIRDHRMHRERFFIPPATITQIRKHWGELFCVGTTCLRVLESLGNLREDNGGSEGIHGETDIFLHPGKAITSIRGLVTNFHLPQSSLFILVCALVGRVRALELYQLAVDRGYRFFSYGDAMLVLR